MNFSGQGSRVPRATSASIASQETARSRRCRLQPGPEEPEHVPEARQALVERSRAFHEAAPSAEDPVEDSRTGPRARGSAARSRPRCAIVARSLERPAPAGHAKRDRDAIEAGLGKSDGRPARRANPRRRARSNRPVGRSGWRPRRNPRPCTRRPSAVKSRSASGTSRVRPRPPSRPAGRQFRPGRPSP